MKRSFAQMMKVDQCPPGGDEGLLQRVQLARRHAHVDRAGGVRDDRDAGVVEEALEAVAERVVQDAPVLAGLLRPDAAGVVHVVRAVGEAEVGLRPAISRSRSVATVASPQSSRCGPSSQRSPGRVTGSSGASGTSSSPSSPVVLAARIESEQLVELGVGEAEALERRRRRGPAPAAPRRAAPRPRRRARSAYCRRCGRRAPAPASGASTRITGAVSSPSCRAASTRPWPAIRMPASSTRHGFSQPYSIRLPAEQRHLPLVVPARVGGIGHQPVDRPMLDPLRGEAQGHGVPFGVASWTPDARGGLRSSTARRGAAAEVFDIVALGRDQGGSWIQVASQKSRAVASEVPGSAPPAYDQRQEGPGNNGL